MTTSARFEQTKKGALWPPAKVNMMTHSEPRHESGLGNQVLLKLADLLVRHLALPELFYELARGLQEVVSLDFILLLLHDPSSNTMRLQLWAGGNTAPDLPALPVENSASGWVWRNQQPLVFADLRQETRFPAMLDTLRECGYRSCCLLPLTTAQKKLGVLGFGSSCESAYEPADLQAMKRVAELVALVAESALNQQALKEENKRLHALLELNNALVTYSDLPTLLPEIGNSIHRITDHDYASLALQEDGALYMYPLASPAAQQIIGSQATVPLREAPAGRAILDRETKFFSQTDLESIDSPFVGRLLRHGVQSLYCIPLQSAKGILGTLNLGSTREKPLDPNDLSLLTQMARLLAVSLENARTCREIGELKNKVKTGKRYLENETDGAADFEEIIGDHPEIRKVLTLVKTVAPTDSTALILGETGTGKELIARAIHRMSARREGRFIKMNCAAIPTGLLESELFGYERGAFTGALSQKIGRLELADKGTLFLDEIGDISLELQPKLLRVLQDQEFERLGSTRTIRIDVRLIAATNVDLARAVAERKFRSDLFYRLSVFPLQVPPLRLHSQDIPLLVRYFVQKFGRRMNKQIDTIPSETMAALMNWSWPGNVRELENFVERAVILTKGPVLRAPLGELRPQAEGDTDTDEML